MTDELYTQHGKIGPVPTNHPPGQQFSEGLFLLSRSSSENCAQRGVTEMNDVEEFSSLRSANGTKQDGGGGGHSFRK